MRGRDAAGILSVYDTPTELNTMPSKESYRAIKPLKIVKNLVTAITAVEINNDNSILAYASDDKLEHIKLVHLSSMTVFSNWPDKNEKMGYIHAMSMSGDNRTYGVNE